jgi:hypothetical protein
MKIVRFSKKSITGFKISMTTRSSGQMRHPLFPGLLHDLGLNPDVLGHCSQPMRHRQQAGKNEEAVQVVSAQRTLGVKSQKYKITTKLLKID